jgi:hypothetical protein
VKHWWTKYRNPQEKAELIGYLFLGAALVVMLILVSLNLL